MGSLYVVFGLAIIVYLLLTLRVLLLRYNGKKLIANFENRNGIEQVQLAKDYVSDYSRKNKQALDALDITLEAFTLGSVKYSEVSSQDWAQQLANVSNIKTGRFYDVIMLSQGQISIQDTELNKFFIIPSEAILKAEIREVQMDSEDRTLVSRSQLPYSVRAYNLIIECENKIIKIVFYNTLNIGASASFDIKKLLTDKSEQNLTNYMMGNYFLKVLGDSYPTLKIPTCFN